MSFTAEMFPTVSSGAVELPKTFVNSLRILFDILDEDKDGLVPISVIEQRWQGNGISGLPNGVLQSLRQVTPADGMLDFDLFCSALKLTLKTNKEQARNNQNRQPNKAAVRPNNFHPMYGHQHIINSAPYLRVNPTLKSDGNGNNNHITTAENPKERSTNVGELIKPSIVSREHASLWRKNDAPHHFPVNRSINQPVERVDAPKAKGNVYPSHGVSARVLSPTRNEAHHSGQVSNPPAYTHPHRRNPHGNAPPHDLAEHSKTRSHDERERHPPHYEGGRNSRPNLMSPPSQKTRNDRAARTLSSSSTKSRPSTSSSSSGVYSPNGAENQQLKSSVVKSPPPYMAHIKPQSQKVVKAQLVYPQNNPHQPHPTYTGSHTAHTDPQPHPIGRTPQPLTETDPQRANCRRRKDEPRRHTLSNGITTDFNALKRMKDLEQERDVLHQGQDLLDRCREWYQDELVQIKEQQHQLITGKEMNGSSRRDRVTFRTSRILEINRQMRALMNSTEAFPEHMNLAIPQRQPAPSDPASPMMDKIKDQNRRLTQEVSFKNDRIASLEKEKAALIRQLFDVRGRSRTRERPEMSTLF